MKEIFLERMKDLLKDKYEDYLKTLNEPVIKGLRVNTLKISVNDFIANFPYQLQKTPIADNVFKIKNDLKLGNTFEHKAGLFYLQEVSATSAVEVMHIKPGDWVLDLCAAPGGKTTQIAARLDNQGLLITNEYDNSRANILLSNCERCGVSNAIICNSNVGDLCQNLYGLIDKVLVDAPCSGEGMFKKESQALSDWSVEHVKSCAIRQRKILDDAYFTLKENGELTYSTCTFSIEENEMVIADFLKTHPDMQLIDCDVDFGCDGETIGLCDGKKVRRLFPMDLGEGHFVARMRKIGTSNKVSKLDFIKNDKHKLVEQFMEECFISKYPYSIINDKVYLANIPLLNLKKVKVFRQMVLMGEIIKNRFEPHHSLYVSSIMKNNFKSIVEINDEDLVKYLQGETIKCDCSLRGYQALSHSGIIFGFGKCVDGVIKNKYPKGLRLR